MYCASCEQPCSCPQLTLRESRVEARRVLLRTGWLKLNQDRNIQLRKLLRIQRPYTPCLERIALSELNEVNHSHHALLWIRRGDALLRIQL